MYTVTTTSNKNTVTAAKIANSFNLTVIAKSGKSIAFTGTNNNVARFIAIFAQFDYGFSIK